MCTHRIHNERETKLTFHFSCINNVKHKILMLNEDTLTSGANMAVIMVI